MNYGVSFAGESGTKSVRNDDDHPDTPSTTRKDKSRSKGKSKKKKTASSRSSRCVPNKQPKITVGCRGDPRMNEAVFLRLSNPKLSMTDALLRGGFTFGTQTLPPPPGVLDRNVLDDDGVSLQQRKNQLMRRLRKDRDRKKKKKMEAKQKQKRSKKMRSRQRPLAPTGNITAGSTIGSEGKRGHRQKKMMGVGVQMVAIGNIQLLPLLPLLRMMMGVALPLLPISSYWAGRQYWTG